MSHMDSIPEGVKYRAFLASGDDGTAGAWGYGDLLCVKDNGSGLLTVAGATDAEAVIHTSEGKRDSTHADYKKVVGGKKYTALLGPAIITEVDEWTVPASIAAGDKVYAGASGAAVLASSASAGAVYLGKVVKGEGTSGLIFVLDVGAEPPFGQALTGADFNFTTIAGGSAGDHTVTGIATTDTLAAVINIDIGGDAITTLTSEFTISAADTINNTGGTDSTGGVLFVCYINP